MKLTTLTDPYRDIDDEDKVRINADVPINEKLLIQAVCPIRGVLQAMVNLFIKSVTEEMKQTHITTYADYDRFLEIVHRRTNPVPVGEGHNPPNRGGTEGIRDQHPPVKNLRTNRPSLVGKGGKKVTKKS